MSRKSKSELSFIIKLSLLFLILFASKINKPNTEFVLNKSILSKNNSIYSKLSPIEKSSQPVLNNVLTIISNNN